MKKFISRAAIFVMAALVLAAVAVPAETQAASVKKQALKAYKKYLSKSKVRASYEDWTVKLPSEKVKFSIIYLDNDNVPELVVYRPHGTLEGELLCGPGFYVYSYRSGKVKLIGFDYWEQHNEGQEFKLAYAKKKGIIREKAVISKGVREVAYLSCNWDDYNWIGRKEAAVIRGSRDYQTLRLHKNTKANRKKYIK